jgi:REP element-mobilizing transposase RayT
MPRAHRVQIAGGLYHLTSRGNRRQSIFGDDQDRRWFLGLLGIVVDRLGWRCHSYCLMPNHYHLVAETPEPDLSRGMRELNSRYASCFKWRYGLDGHLFQGRFRSILVEREEHLLEAARYVVLNPVRAGLCENPEEWRWSSYRATLGLERKPAFLSLEPLLGRFGGVSEKGRLSFAAFVREGVAPEPRHGRSSVGPAATAGVRPRPWPG